MGNAYMDSISVSFKFCNIANIDVLIYNLVLRGINNLKSVRFFKLVLRYDHSIVITGNLAFTIQQYIDTHMCISMSS